jgi:hypothetical protein
MAVLAGAPGMVGVADAHVAPSPTDNNRYLKVTLLPDRVRVAYTVYFGDRPGAGERQRMDTNGDGALDQKEAAAFGDDMAQQLAPKVTVEVDGARAPGAWKVSDVGLGLPQTSAGSFSVDLLLEVPVGAGAHTLVVTDDFDLPPSGESELRVEESPGVRASEGHLGRDGTGLKLRYAFRGAPEKAGARTVLVKYAVDAQAAAEAKAAKRDAPRAATATGAAAAPKQHGRALWLALAVVGLAVATLGIAALRKKSA